MGTETMTAIAAKTGVMVSDEMGQPYRQVLHVDRIGQPATARQQHCGSGPKTARTMGINQAAAFRTAMTSTTADNGLAGIRGPIRRSKAGRSRNRTRVTALQTASPRAAT
jgi:hypothetical protein